MRAGFVWNAGDGGLRVGECARRAVRVERFASSVAAVGKEHGAHGDDDGEQPDRRRDEPERERRCGPGIDYVRGVCTIHCPHLLLVELGHNSCLSALGAA